MLTLRQALVAVAVTCVLITGLVGAGLAERSHRAREQSRAIAEVASEVGPLDSPELDSYRYLFDHLQCLLYRRGRNPFALELCIDEKGRVVEAIDRRTAPKPLVHSLRDDPTRSSVRVDRAEVTRLLHSFGVPFRLLPRS
jgi:hypothetical protein